MKKEWLILLILVVVMGCVQSPAPELSAEAVPEIIEEVYTKQIQGLGTLCSGQEECQKFCSMNRGQCESYCRGKELELCGTIFPPDSQDQGPHTNNGCTGTGRVTFTAPPMHIEKIEIIEPIGLMIGGHVTPIDHGYYYANTWQPGSSREDTAAFVEVMAPAAGVVTSVQSMPQEYSSSSWGDYRVVLHHSCTFYTIYIHINQLSEKLQAIADTGKTVEVKAGEIIGKAPGFDFSVHDDEVTLPGFIVAETYFAEPWKLHNVDMFEYFIEPIRTQLLARDVRQQAPRGGKIDYDIDGKLVGNWFEENTNGYFGKEEYQRSIGYWSTHLAFVYDGLVPSTLVVSMGDFNGEAQQFGVQGNTPDPATVDVSDGIVKYELVRYDHLTDQGVSWDRVHFAKVTSTKPSSGVEGVVLVEMLGDRKIKFEAFPGKTASQVSGFTGKVKVYER